MIGSRSVTSASLAGDLPVVYSAVDPQALIARLPSFYHIDLAIACQFWHRGLSDIYLVQTLTKQYIFRISHHHWRSKTDIDFELEFLNFLAKQRLPVAAPIKTKLGTLSLEIDASEGKRYAALFHYAPGEVALGDLNHTQSFLLGKTVARLHKVGRNFQTISSRKWLDLEHLLDDSLQIIAPFFHHRSQDLKYLLDAIARIKAQLQDLPTESPYWSVCWGDPHSGNIHFREGNQMTLFDFDQCGYGWRVFDIAKFWQVALQTGLSRTVRQAFLDGYRSFEKITDIELDALQSLTQTAYIWSWAIAISNAKLYDYSRLDSSYFTHRLEQFKRLNSKDWQLF